MHWTREAYDLVDRAVEVYVDHETKGFRDKARALGEVMDRLEKRDRSYRTRATNAVRRDYGGKRLRYSLNDEDTRAYWLMVSKITKTPQR